MKLLEKILLAIDFSKSSDNVVENTIVLAKTFQSEVTLIYVLPDNINDEKANLFLKESAISQLEAINERIKSEGVKTVQPVLEYGIHFDKIIQTADSMNANIILIGAGEKLKKDNFQLGTTAVKIIRKSDKPVFVVKKDKPLKIKRIICPVDFSNESERALKNAITMCRRFKAELLIFSVHEMIYSGSLRPAFDWNELNEKSRSEHIEEFNSFLDKFNLTDLSWEKETQGGDPSSEILEAITRNKSDMIIMGTTGKTGLNRIFMGSVTEKVIREVPCSFITLKSKNFISLKLEGRISEIQRHYDVASQLIKDGFYEESINEFKICLRINDMHIPSLKGIAIVYKKLGNNKMSEKYRMTARDVMAKIWDRKIEEDIRRHHR